MCASEEYFCWRLNNVKRHLSLRLAKRAAAEEFSMSMECFALLSVDNVAQTFAPWKDP